MTDIILRNFSRYASTYDQYAQIQRRVSSELLNQIQDNGISGILEIGCGTGNFTLALRDRFKQAQVLAFDISERMIQEAKAKIKDRNTRFFVADARKFSSRLKFGLIASNACFQWLDDIDAALNRYKGMLKERGFILFSNFGPRTFGELKQVLELGSLSDASIAANGFLPSVDLKAMLRRHFSESEIREKEYKEYFPSIRQLLAKIKYSGISGNGLNKRVYLSQNLLDNLNRIYLDKFGSIVATYQVIFAKAIK